jgi:hypothetical protein
VPVEMIQAGDETLHSEVHKLISFIPNKEETPEHWRETIIILIDNNSDKTACMN